MNSKLIKWFYILAIISMVVANLALTAFVANTVISLWPTHYNKADLNRDGKVNLTDFSIFEYYYGGGK